MMITRYSLDYENCNLEYDPDGDVVDYGDHCAVVFVLQSRLESLEKDAAKWKNAALNVYSNIDFALSLCQERGADSLAIEELKEAKLAIDAAMQANKQ